MSWTADYTGQTPETMDDTRVGPGWHLATLVACDEEAGTGKLITRWRVDSPPFKGATLTDNYNNPALANTEKEMEGQQKRFRIWAIRVGLTTKEHAGKNVQVDPKKAIGTVRVIHCVRETYINDKGNQAETVKIPFSDIYAIDRPEIPVEERVRLGLGLLDGQVMPVAGQPAPKGRKATEEKVPAFDPAEV